MRHLLLIFLVSAFLTPSGSIQAGWFSDDNFYVIVQNNQRGEYLDGWITQGAPKNENGIYIFTLYRTSVEKRIPIQGTVVTKVGPKWESAVRFHKSVRDGFGGW